MKAKKKMVLIPSEDPTRYQFQPWYIKLWRCRHLLSVPYRAVKSYLDHDCKEPFYVCWSIEHGMAHCDMNYVYTWNEVKNDIWDDE